MKKCELDRLIEKDDVIAVIVIRDNDDKTEVNVIGKNGAERKRVEEIILNFAEKIQDSREDDQLPF